jgi:glucan biosynthesis protein
VLSCDSALVAALIPASNALAFAFEDVIARAQHLAAGSYLPPVETPQFMREMGYDQYRGMRHQAQHNLWRDAHSAFQVSPVMPGSVYARIVPINEVNGSTVRRLAFRKEHFTFDEPELGQRIAAEVGLETDPWAQLRAGARAFLAAATDPAIRRIVLIDGPSVLGWEEWRRIDNQYALGMVRAVFEINIAAGNVAEQPVEPLAHLIVGALNEAALTVAAASDAVRAREEFAASMDRVLDALRMVAMSAPKRAAHR